MATPTSRPLAGYRFLIVEDEMLQAVVMQDMLADLGGTVVDVAHSYDRARTLVDHATFDCALLDINLGGALSYQIAEILKARGVPFIVCTAYGDVVSVHPTVGRALRLTKPIESADLRDAVLELLHPAS